jgi:hypothetical protein
MTIAMSAATIANPTATWRGLKATEYSAFEGVGGGSGASGDGVDGGSGAAGVSAEGIGSVVIGCLRPRRSRSPRRS